MNLVELFRRTFLEGYASRDLQMADILICLLVTSVMAIYIFCVYRGITKNTFYNKNYNLSLLALSVIIAAIILTIQSNIVISLGMVGALSIVRFRTAVKDPMDLVFLFWSIGVGIICGAGFAAIAVMASLVVSVIVILFSKISAPKGALILLVNSTSYENEDAIMEMLQKYCDIYKVKARNLTKNHLDMAVEVHVAEQGALVRSLMELPDVCSASLVSHDGEVTL